MQSSAAVLSNTEPSRGPFEYAVHPRPDLIVVAGGLASPLGILSVTAGGKTLSFELTRKQMFQLGSRCLGALANMEPGK